MNGAGPAAALTLVIVGTALAVAARGDESPTEVTINVHPGKSPNALGDAAGGSIPVVLFGSSKFDVRSIDPLSLTLGATSFLRHSRVELSRASESLCEVACEVRDVGGPDSDSADGLGPPDGYDDLTCRFSSELALAGEGIQSVTLMGTTFPGDDGGTTPLVGTDFAIEPTVLEAIVRCCIDCDDNGNCSGCNGDIYSCNDFLMTCDGDTICNDCSGCAPPRIS